MILPPDYTRFHSQAGKLTKFVAEHYNFISSGDEKVESANKRPKLSSDEIHPPDIKIMPALGTHAPMTADQVKAMFGEELAAKEPTPFMVHDWRNDVETIGHAPAEMVRIATHGILDEPWPAQLNKFVWEKRRHDPAKQAHKSLVLSIGQVVPHEVMGMANFNKNLFVGVGGVEAINLSHIIGGVFGMEKLMGRGSNPLRSILNYASEHFLQNELDLWYILTVMATDDETGEKVMRGFYIGNDIEAYNQACSLSQQVNITLLEKSPSRVVVFLDEDEFSSTWLGNKGIYRIRMAIADGGELIILAPGVCRFGEDDKVDELIRKYGYIGTKKIMKAMRETQELKENLSVVAHLIHGSTENRFKVVYCPGHLTKKEVEGAGFEFGDLEEMKQRYPKEKMKDGWNTEEVDGQASEFYYISNPALGLWALKSRFEESGSGSAGDAATDSGQTLLSTSDQQPAGESGGIGGWAKPP